MKKRLFALLCAVMVGGTALPAYAAGPAAETSYAEQAVAGEDAGTAQAAAEAAESSAAVQADAEATEASGTASADGTTADADSAMVVDEAQVLDPAYTDNAEELETAPGTQQEENTQAMADAVEAAEAEAASVDESVLTSPYESAEEIVGAASLPTTDAKIATGIYYITLKADSAQILGVAKKSDKIRANIEVQKYDDTVQQRFVIKSLGGGLYNIWNYDSGLAVCVSGSGSAAGTNMVTFWRNGSTGQKFYLLKDADGSIVIRPQCTKCVVEAKGTVEAGANIQTNTYAGTDNQKFILKTAKDVAITSGTYYIHSMLDDTKTLYVTGASTKNGANIEIRKNARTTASQITLFARSDGTFILSPVNSSMAIEPKSKGTVNCENVQQGTLTTKSVQRWKIISNGRGYYNFVLADSGKCIAVDSSKTADGTNVNIFNKGNAASRLFSLERVDGGRTVPNGIYTFTNLKNTKLRLEVKNGSSANWTHIQVGTAADAARQKFTVTYQSNGYYRICNVGSGKYLHVKGGKGGIGKEIIQFDKLSNNCQYFTMTEFNGTGTYTMITKLGDYTVGTGNKKASGSYAKLSEHKSWLHERWDLTPANNTYLVAIDAGHQRYQNTGKEPNGPGSSVYKQKVTSGTYGPWSRLDEYVLNLQVSLKLQKELEARGYSVYMIRTTHDVNISNAERATMANNAGADIFIRIHANGDDYSSSVNGALCYMPSSANRYLTSSVIAGSQKLSRCVINSYCAATGLKNLGVLADDDMTGINWAKMPVTIVEMGFMSNQSDDLFMASAAGQAKIVTGIANGVDAYFNS